MRSVTNKKNIARRIMDMFHIKTYMISLFERIFKKVKTVYFVPCHSMTEFSVHTLCDPILLLASRSRKECHMLSRLKPFFVGEPSILEQVVGIFLLLLSEIVQTYEIYFPPTVFIVYVQILCLLNNTNFATMFFG
jgi:hypothetical protein